MTVVTETQTQHMGIKVEPHLWVDEYADYLYNYAMTRLSDEEVAKDLIQETFLSALENVGKFEGRCTEKTWLTAILKHKILDVYRSRCRVLEAKKTRDSHNMGKTFFQEDGHWNVSDQPRPFSTEQAGKLDNKEFQSILLRCMQKLPALWMTIFSMKFMEEENSDNICRELKVTAANYWVIIHRAKINLRACLQKNWL
ncbi:MAG: sigma-70 family RNA polymerase sigma factor [Ferruginibacter sp.]